MRLGIGKEDREHEERNKLGGKHGLTGSKLSTPGYLFPEYPPVNRGMTPESSCQVEVPRAKLKFIL